MPVTSDEHVGRLDIPVHNQVRMRMRYRRENIEKEPDSGWNIQSLLVRVLVDGLALDVFEYEIGLLPHRGNACINKLGDVRMS